MKNNRATPYAAHHPVDLSAPVPREEVHNRRIKCDGYARADGLIDIEAEITDNKTYAFPTEFRGEITPDDFVHRMKVRITTDRDLKIVAAEAVTIAGPYAICPTANKVFESLVGISIGPGWRRRVNQAIGGRHGCTHITELMGSVGTIAFQTLFGEIAREKRTRLGSGGAGDSSAGAATTGGGVGALADSCVAYAVDAD